MHSQRFYTLSASCPGRRHRRPRRDFIASRNGWILESSAFSSGRSPGARYFMRLEVKADSLPHALEELQAFPTDYRNADWKIKRLGSQNLRRHHGQQAELPVTCWRAGNQKELDIEIPASSTTTPSRVRRVARASPFHHVPVNLDTMEP